MADWDLVIRNAKIVDGTGRDIFVGDVAVKDGRIARIGTVDGSGSEEIDARDKYLTPGFVDIHTHYDGQVTWEDTTMPSAGHGVTTAVMGNCGVGFAPCKEADRSRLINLMEGVEDIPEIVMTQGLPWAWESFPEYLDFVASRRRDIDVAAQLPHAPLRVYVMGERAVAGEDANEDDIARMSDMAAEAVAAGAIGFATSRSIFHRSKDGTATPTMGAPERELRGILEGMKRGGDAVFEAIFDYENLEDEFALLERLARFSQVPVTFSLFQSILDHNGWRRLLDLTQRANDDGVVIKGQVIGRPTGFLLGLDLSYTPFSLYPSYLAISHLTLDEKLAKMRDPAFRRQLLSEEPGRGGAFEALKMFTQFDWIYRLGNPPMYEPDPNTSVAGIALAEGRTPEEVVYDMLLEEDGKAVLFLPAANFIEHNLDAALEMLRDRNTVLGLGDGGAHYGVICDAGYPTFMLTYWARDRKVGERMGLPEVVKALSFDTAHAVGLRDRGRIAVGYKADLNIIDFARLTLHSPEVAYDLPAGGRRLTQKSDGYVATIVSGKVTYREGRATGHLPGTLVRGSRPAPQVAEHA